MALPKPDYSFTIPSLHDDTILDCRLYHPKHHHESDPVHGTKAAIIAHPYAPLGGCYDDPIVASVGETLLHAGYIVATFNFRYSSQPIAFHYLSLGSEDRPGWDMPDLLFSGAALFNPRNSCFSVLTAS